MTPGLTATAQPESRTDTPAPVRRLLELSVPVIVKLAERRMRLSEVSRMATGTIIELAKPADQPLDLMINNVVVGRGEAVKVGENFGLRISCIGPAGQTIRALGPGN